MSAIKAIHASARALGIEEDTRRDIYRRETGKSSLTQMSSGEQGKVLEALRAMGATPAPKGRKLLTGPYAKKLQALWIAGWNLGIVRNRDDKAMLAFIERQTGIANTAFLRASGDANKAVEALKAWLARDGEVDWSLSSFRSELWLNDPRGQIAWAQALKLIREGAVPDIGAVRVVSDVFVQFHPAGGADPLGYGDRDWIDLHNAMGERVRSLKAPQTVSQRRTS